MADSPASCYSCPVNESRAIAAVEETYGSLEDLVFFVASEHPELLDGNVEVAKLASVLNLDPNVAHHIINRSNRFRMLVRADLVNREFDLLAEGTHVHEVVKVATNQGAKRMNSKGELVDVDHSPADVMAAGKYLNDYRGTSIQNERGRTTVGVQVNFFGADGKPIGEVIDVEAVELHGDGEEVPYHVPAHAGDLPPPKARERYALADGKQTVPVGRPGGELDFYSDEAEEEARDAHYDERTRRHEARQRGDEVGPEPAFAEGTKKRDRRERSRETMMERIRAMKAGL